MPIVRTIPIEEDGQIDFTLCIKQIVDYVLSHQKGNPEEGIMRVNIKRTFMTIWEIMKQELPTNPMLELDINDPKVLEMCRITLTNIMKSYGVSTVHMRRLFPWQLKIAHRHNINIRYRAGLPYFKKENYMIPSTSTSTSSERAKLFESD